MYQFLIKIGKRLNFQYFSYSWNGRQVRSRINMILKIPNFHECSKQSEMLSLGNACQCRDLLPAPEGAGLMW